MEWVSKYKSRNKANATITGRRENRGIQEPWKQHMLHKLPVKLSIGTKLDYCRSAGRRDSYHTTTSKRRSKGAVNY